MNYLNSEELLKRLVHAINKEESKDLKSYDERVKYWMNKFSSNGALKWDDKILDLESQYLKSCFVKKKLYNCYEIKSLSLVDEEFKDKIIVWDEDVSSMVIDAIVVPSSKDIISGNDNKELHDIYYSNGIKLRKKILNIMNGEKLSKDEVLITRSYGILADYIMHVNYNDIKTSILNVLECARVNMIKTIAICLSNKLEEVNLVYDTIIEYLGQYNDYFDKIIIAIENKDVREEFIEDKNKELR